MLRPLVRKTLSALKCISPSSYDVLTDQMFAAQHRRTGDRFQWQRIQPCLERKVEPACAVVGGDLFIFAGYKTLAETSGLIEIYDLARECWKPPMPYPDGLPQSHQGLTSDGIRHVYLAGGQIGPQASPCTANASVFDTVERSWKSLPPLPEARYAPILRILDGRLHAVAGAMPDRFGHATEHWSLAIESGRATENRWRAEPPIPHGGHHRASAVIEDRLFSLGGQERDVRPVPNDPKFTVDWGTPHEIMYDDVYSYRASDGEWKKLAPMPVVATHAEFSVFVKGKYILVLGGLGGRLRLVGAIQVYDTETDRWIVAGQLPYPMKGHVAVEHHDTIFVFAGQRSVSLQNLNPGDVLRSGWKAKLSDLDALFAEGAKMKTRM